MVTTPLDKAATLLASASSLEDIKRCIERFYCGTKFDLIGQGEGLWSLQNPLTRKQPEMVRVRYHKGRYRFEGVH